MNITVVGMGYVGLSNAIVLAQHNKVFAVDIDQQRISLINKRISPITDEYIKNYFQEKNLSIEGTLDAKTAYLNSDLIVIATPTNHDPLTNKINTSSVEKVLLDVIKTNPNSWIIIKSTVEIGFTRKIIEKYGYKKIIFSPEFLREGKALYDNLFPTRIIVGIPEREKTYLDVANQFIGLMVSGAIKTNIETYVVGSTEAEAIKLFSNTYLAMRVAYFNELDTFSEWNNLNTKDIIDGVCSDPRIGKSYNNPSFGYGGYCLPKDTKELQASFTNIPQNLVSAIVFSNDTRKEFIARRILDYANRIVSNDSNTCIGIFRLTMKTDSDNFRSSSILDVMTILRNSNASIVVYEPTLNVPFFSGYKVINDIHEFKSCTTVIVANRYESILNDVQYKTYSRDIFMRD